MVRTSLELELAALTPDTPGAVELSRDAIVAAYVRSGTAADAEPRVVSVSERIRAGEFTEGRLIRRADRPIGVAHWEVGHPSGITLQILYLIPGEGGPADYDAVLRKVTEAVGPIVFAPGGLVGLSDEEERTLMNSRGFGRFSRSEMRWPTTLDLPTGHAPIGVQVRPVIAEDEPTIARLHLAAFGGTFDQYMYLSDPDPAVDSSRGVGEMMRGRFGEFLGWASSLVESGGRALGASLVVRAPYGPLLISVMVDPVAQGRGLGRTLVLANLHALRARGETVAALNVTEGNTHAVRLYEHIGFVRTIGPEHAWYSRAAVPVAPGEVFRGPPSGPVRSGSSAAAGSRTRPT
ncbi:MAG: GNAT family N-acetyltransferase [Thermoplasmata archaeon]|nr:GNAT family N-acetyltransferase [Thermoplasmata archaeon]